MGILLILFVVIIYIPSLVLGIYICVTKEFTFRTGAVANETEAIIVGLLIIAVSSYAFISIVWKAYKGKTEEEKDEKD